MTQERVDIPIGIDLANLNKGIDSMVGLLEDGLGDVEAATGRAQTQLGSLTDQVNSFSSASSFSIPDLSSTWTATSDQISNASSQVDGLTGKWAEQKNQLDSTTNSVAFFNTTVTQNQTEKAVDRVTAKFGQLRSDVQSTRIEFERLASQSASVVVRQPQSPQQSSGSKMAAVGSLIQIGAVGAQVSAMSKISGGLKSVQSTVRSTRATFDSFRLAKLAPPVNEEMNVVRKGVKAVGDVASGTIDKVRQAADASLDGWKDTANETAKAASKVSNSLDNAALTTAKYTWKAKAAAGSLKLLKTVFFPLRDTIGQFSDKATQASAAVQKVDQATQSAAASAGHAAAKTSALGWVMTGTFEQGSASVSALAPAMKAAYLPSRLLFREFEGGRRVVGAATTVIATLTSPLARMATSVATSKAQWRALRTELKDASLAHKAVSSTALLLTQTLAPLKRLLPSVSSGFRLARGTAALATRTFKTGARSLLGWSKSADKAGDEAKQSVGPINRLKAAVGGVTKKASGGLGGFLKGIVSSKLAVGALLAGTLAWGGSTAIATETATVKFGTLLQDMDQGKALIQEITSFSAATPFSNAALRESAGLLLNAQVPADQITAKLTKLGDIAAGTGKPIKDFASIFAKVSNTGKMGLDQVNQLAERGVPIYGALQKTLGVTKGELSSMISDGKLGAGELEAAIDSLTTGTGVFAGGMAKQSTTVAGLWSTLKDNVGIAFETLVGGFVMGSKSIMTGTITAVQTITSYLMRLQPVFTAIFGAAKAGLTAFWTLGQSVFAMFGDLVTNVFGDFGNNGISVFDTIVRALVTFYTTMAYSLGQIPLIAAIAFDSTGLFFLTMANDIGYFFGTKLPAWFGWFGENWSRLFLDAAAIVGTVFTNITSNIKNAMTAIWDYIASGGTKSFKFAWTPVLDGFRKTVDDLPDIPPRIATQLEVSLQNDIDSMQGTFSDGLDAAINEALSNIAPPEEIKLKSTTAQKAGAEDGETEEDDKKKKRSSFVVDSLNKGSVEAFKAIFSGQNKDKTAQKSLSVQKGMKSALDKMANKEPIEIAVAGGVE